MEVAVGEETETALVLLVVVVVVLTDLMVEIKEEVALEAAAVRRKLGRMEEVALEAMVEMELIFQLLDQALVTEEAVAAVGMPPQTKPHVDLVLTAAGTAS